MSKALSVLRPKKKVAPKPILPGLWDNRQAQDPETWEGSPNQDDVPLPAPPARKLEHKWEVKKGAYECAKCGFRVDPRTFGRGELLDDKVEELDWELIEEAVPCDEETVARVMNS